MNLQEYEKKHNGYLRRNGGECAVLLKTDGKFPLEEAGKLALYGSGARHTIKGGTGSGEVNSRYFLSIEKCLKKAGFTITTTDWLDAYDRICEEAKVQFMKDLKAEARRKHTLAFMLGMGRSMPQPEYDLPLEGEGDTAIYVLSRISGEGSDRGTLAGEIRLSETEKREIRLLNEKYERFMLVLNVGGVLDLGEAKEVKNILLLSQLGVKTGDILADLLLGKQNPSGKLTATWAGVEDYPPFADFGERDETRYREGLYMGYRYFDSIGKKPLFPFGFGGSYTSFGIEKEGISLEGEVLQVRAKVTNTGTRAGKEVFQLYISCPQGRLDKPYQVLSGFEKTRKLLPGEAQSLTVFVRMSDLASYDSEKEAYVLEAGSYILRAGSSSADTRTYGLVRVEEELCVRSVRKAFGPVDFEDYKPGALERRPQAVQEDWEVLYLPADAVRTEETVYDPVYEIEPVVEKLEEDALIRMNLGAFDPKNGVASMIGNAGFTVAGAAGQTCMNLEGIGSMVMADGPAGLRISRNYVRTEKGAGSVGSSLPESVTELMPAILRKGMELMSYHPKKGDEILHQYATAIPIGTAIAQSFNRRFAEGCGDLVGDEMERFGIHLWLAPAMNLHRSIRCGRNFEYFSEDPVVSGEMAAAITRGVQAHPHCGTVIKHFAANNQEYNRTQNNSQVSERVLRELYLKGFEIAVRKSQPKAVMTSYNLINGTHTGEHRGLIEDILRAEFGFQGIVMTDWVVSLPGKDKDNVHPVSRASKVVMAGGDLFMPGGKGDYMDLKKGLKKGEVTLEQLRINASRTARMAALLCGERE